MNSDICRCCAGTIDFDNDAVLSVFETLNEMIIAEMILDISGILIEETDKLPLIICAECADELEKSYDFKRKCIYSNTALREKFLSERQIKSENEEEIIIEEIEVLDENQMPFEYVQIKDIKTPTEKRNMVTVKKELVEMKKLLESLESTSADQHCDKGMELELLFKLEKSLTDTEKSIKDKLPKDNIRSFVKTFTVGTEKEQKTETKPKPKPKNKVSTKTTSKKHKCCSCTGKIFSSYDELYEHAVSNHYKPPPVVKSEEFTVLQCEICYETFLGSGFVAGEKNHSIKPYSDRLKIFFIPCCACDASFETYEELKEHSVQHVGNKAFGDTNKEIDCEICFRRFTKRKGLLEHKKIGFKARKEKLRNRNNIQRGNITSDSMLLPIELEETDEVRCCGCKSVFLTYEELSQHSKLFHASLRAPLKDPTLLECDVCFTHFQSSDFLEKHRNRPYLKKNCICTICGDAFAENAQLKKHEKIIHPSDDMIEEIIIYQCHLCDKKFKCEKNYKQHLDLHNGIGLECNECGKIFVNKFKLEYHMTIHSNATPFSCKICHKKFKRRDLVKVHMRVHTGEKPYTCPFCTLAFAHWSDMNRHKMTHTGDYPHKCNICGKKFARRQHCESHEAQHIVN